MRLRRRGPWAAVLEEKLDQPTQKPAFLFETLIRNHLRPGGLVYDPFAGSGTVSIAAEALGRKALAMEIDPRFVQLSIERWQRFSGRTAERIGANDRPHA